MVELTVIVITDCMELPGAGITTVGLNVKLTPYGAPSEDNETGAENDPIGVSVTVAESDPPCWMLTDDGLTERSKSGAGPDDVTVKVNEVSCGGSPGIATPETVREYDPAAV